jgi:hypothetical protein
MPILAGSSLPLVGRAEALCRAGARPKVRDSPRHVQCGERAAGLNAPTTDDCRGHALFAARVIAAVVVTAIFMDRARTAARPHAARPHATPPPVGGGYSQARDPVPIRHRYSGSVSSSAALFAGVDDAPDVQVGPARRVVPRRRDGRWGQIAHRAPRRAHESGAVKLVMIKSTGRYQLGGRRRHGGPRVRGGGRQPGAGAELRPLDWPVRQVRTCRSRDVGTRRGDGW